MVAAEHQEPVQPHAVPARAARGERVEIGDAVLLEPLREGAEGAAPEVVRVHVPLSARLDRRTARLSTHGARLASRTGCFLVGDMSMSASVFTACRASTSLVAP